jgi:hypothetical protein
VRSPGHVATAERGLDPAAELPDREGLGYVVVGAHLEPGDLVDLVPLRRQHDDRHLTARAKAPAHLYPIELGEHDVKDHQVEPLFSEPIQGLLPIHGSHHLITFLAERVGEKRLHGLLIVDQQDPRLSSRHA